MAVKDLPDLDCKALCYMNQERLMRANVKLDITEEQAQEIKRCASDIDYFIRNYVKITTLDNGVQCMNLRPYQEEFINACFNNRFVIAMMARQMGKTTTVMAYLLHQAITRKHIRIAVLANKGDTAKEILDRIKQAYEELPYFLQVGVKEWNKSSIALGNGTKILAGATSSGSIRGKSCVSGETFVTVKFDDVEETLSIKDLKARLDDNRNYSYSILTYKGFKPFDDVLEMGVKPTLKLIFDDCVLECTHDHKIYVDDVGMVEAQDLILGCVCSGKVLIDIEQSIDQLVYDVLDVDDTHSFIANGVSISNCNIIYLDEFAHIDNDLEFYTSTYPVISSGKSSQVIITSTPNGLNLFYKLYTEATEKRNNFIPLFYDWTHNADIYDDDWEEATRNNMSPQQFAQEYSCAFQGSASTLLSGEALQRLVMRDPLPSDNRHYTIYEEPKPNHNYMAIVDVSEGTGNDSSVVSIFDVTTIPYRHVAMYRNNLIQPIMLADIAFRMAKSYNDAWLGVESNSIGNTVVTALWYEYEYENLICYDDKLNDVRMRIDGLGIKTTKKSKAIGCSRLKSLMETNTLITNDIEAIREFGTFTEQNGTYKADKGKHDDVVMTFVLFALISGTNFFKDMFSDANGTIKDAYKTDIYDSEPFFMIVVNGVDNTDDFNSSVMYR